MGCLGAKAAQFPVCYYTGLAAWACLAVAQRSCQYDCQTLALALVIHVSSRCSGKIGQKSTLAEAAWQA